MIINGKGLLQKAPIKDMMDHKDSYRGTSYGLSEAGYDLRLKQMITFVPKGHMAYVPIRSEADEDGNHIIGFTRKVHKKNTIYIVDERKLTVIKGRFVLASAKEEFQMPVDLVGVVHDKSTLARQGVSVFNTVIEPGWDGFLTLEIAFKGKETVTLASGIGIAQVLFHKLGDKAQYTGKYQNQEDKPIEARSS